jgi:hypothetical protein
VTEEEAAVMKGTRLKKIAILKGKKTVPDGHSKLNQQFHYL